MEGLQKHATLIAVIALILFGTVSVILASTDSLTFDERAHIPAAYSYVKYGDIRLNPEHPPILKDLAGLPLLLLQPQFPLASYEWQKGLNEQWAVGSMFLHCNHPEMACNDAATLTFWSRLPLVFVSLLLATFLFWWGRKLGGSLAGLTALILMVADPNILAHNHLVTTDVGIAAFLLFSFYFFLQFLKNPSWKNTLLAGTFFALVQLVKFSAVLLFPLFLITLFLYVLLLPLPSGKNRFMVLCSYLSKSFVFIFLYAALVYLVYFFHTLSTPVEQLVGIAHMMFPEHALGPLARSIIEYTSSIELLKPYAAYLLGILMVFGRVAGGNTYYFLGDVQSDAQMSYFPIVFLSKETLPFLILLAITLGYSVVRFIRNTFRPDQTQSISLRNRFVRHIDAILMFSFVLLYTLLSIFGNLNIGFRHLFPILPFLYLWIAKTVFTILKDPRLSAGFKNIFGFVVAALMMIQILIPFFSYPNYLSYYNELAGGTAKGYEVATDSNYDWGQDLGRLRNFVAYHNVCVDSTHMTTTLNCNAYLPELPRIEKIRVDYFGGESPSYVLKDVHEGWWSERPRESGWYAISINTLQERWATATASSQTSENGYLWLQKYTPVARAGQSIFIYYIP